MTRSLTAVLMAALIVAACGQAPAASPAGASPTPSTTATVQATASPSPVLPSPSAVGATATEAAARIVGRLDELTSLVADSDGEATAQWAIDEGAWVSENLQTLIAEDALSGYVEGSLALLSAVSDGDDQTDAVLALIGMRDEIAKIAGVAAEGPTPDHTAEPTADPTPTPAPKLSYAKLTNRQWAKLVKNPDAYVGKGYFLWACITQFDAATGTESFRAQASNRKQDYWFSDGVNTFFEGTEAKLEPFVEDDLVYTKVRSLGSYSYDTQNGGNTTVPLFEVRSISRKGSCD